MTHCVNFGQNNVDKLSNLSRFSLSFCSRGCLFAVVSLSSLVKPISPRRIAECRKSVVGLSECRGRKAQILSFSGFLTGPKLCISELFWCRLFCRREPPFCCFGAWQAGNTINLVNRPLGRATNVLCIPGRSSQLEEVSYVPSIHA